MHVVIRGGSRLFLWRGISLAISRAGEGGGGGGGVLAYIIICIAIFAELRGGGGGGGGSSDPPNPTSKSATGHCVLDKFYCMFSPHCNHSCGANRLGT